MSTTTCEEITSELVAFLDGELADEERRPVAAHVHGCLACRREIERLTKVQGLVAELPRIQPSAGFADEFWRKLEAESAPLPANVHRLRPLRWVVPALAAAAVVALALRSEVQPPSPQVASSGTEVHASGKIATAPAAPAPPARAAPQPKAEEPPAQVADVESLRPEDLPPELVEHPELFLRLPVVRRLDTLKYLGSAEDAPGADDGAG
jgi:hypothetical protein